VSSEPREPLRPLLSISLDLAGSTDIKQAVIVQSEGQPEHRKQLYDKYLQLLFSVEQTFYELVDANEVLKVDQLFLVKTIGDEFWYVYEVDDLDVDDLRRTASLLMDVVLSTLQKSLSIALPSHPVPDREKGEADAAVNWIKFAPPLKGTMDLLTDIVELNFARYDHLPSGSNSRTEQGTTERRQPNRRGACLHSGSGGALNAGERHAASTSVRTDYVGIDVDIFFRITRFCRPGLLLVGDNLMARLGCETTDIQGFEHLDIKTLRQSVCLGTAIKYVKRNVVVEALRSDQLQGVGRSYKVHHVFGLASVDSDVFYPLPGRRDLMKPTRSFLAEHGFYSIRRSEWRP
jgi:hypothetical protein